jgi:hypothetical protein
MSLSRLRGSQLSYGTTKKGAVTKKGVLQDKCLGEPVQKLAAVALVALFFDGLTFRGEKISGLNAHKHSVYNYYVIVTTQG